MERKKLFRVQFSTGKKDFDIKAQEVKESEFFGFLEVSDFVITDPTKVVITPEEDTLKKEFDDGSFNTKDVNRHQLDSYAIIMKNKAETLTSGSSQPEVFNVLGQLQTIERVKKSGEMIYNKKEQLTNDLGAKEK